jgi:hypothetical protein
VPASSLAIPNASPADRTDGLLLELLELAVPRRFADLNRGLEREAVSLVELAVIEARDLLDRDALQTVAPAWRRDASRKRSPTAMASFGRPTAGATRCTSASSSLAKGAAQ